MPRRALPGLGLLDEEVVVIEPGVVGLHEISGDLGRGRRTDEALVFGDALPIAKILDEAAAVRLLARDSNEWSRVGEVAVDSRADELDLLGCEASSDDDGPVPGVVGDDLRIDVRHGGRVSLSCFS